MKLAADLMIEHRKRLEAFARLRRQIEWPQLPARPHWQELEAHRARRKA